MIYHWFIVNKSLNDVGLTSFNGSGGVNRFAFINFAVGNDKNRRDTEINKHKRKIKKVRQ